MPSDFSVNKKVEVKIQRLISRLISLRIINDPRLSEVIINEVKVNKDISTARIYFNILNSKNNNKPYEQVLRKATGFIKNEISHQLRLKKVPNLIFKYDTKEQDAMYLNDLINKAIKSDQNEE
jgi:ribosome-binding factor A|tara:strand:- start:275 stop:643 length:369 start_codon:yes stop_codon:yes gene_type:complete